jgi:hypothetical protein
MGDGKTSGSGSKSPFGNGTGNVGGSGPKAGVDFVKDQTGGNGPSTGHNFVEKPATPPGSGATGMNTVKDPTNGGGGTGKQPEGTLRCPDSIPSGGIWPQPPLDASARTPQRDLGTVAGGGPVHKPFRVSKV